MKLQTLLAASIALAPSAAMSQDDKASVRITRIGEQPSKRGPAESFTGSVRVDAPFQATAPGRVGGATVSFEPGVRTAWHTHPLGQTLLVISGAGQVQQWGQPIQQIRPGDVVWIPAGAKHWHGAGATTAMSHVAIAEALDGKVVDWLEQVSDAQYAGRDEAQH